MFRCICILRRPKRFAIADNVSVFVFEKEEETTEETTQQTNTAYDLRILSATPANPKSILRNKQAENKKIVIDDSYINSDNDKSNPRHQTFSAHDNVRGLLWLLHLQV